MGDDNADFVQVKRSDLFVVLDYVAEQVTWPPEAWRAFKALNAALSERPLEQPVQPSEFELFTMGASQPACPSCLALVPWHKEREHAAWHEHSGS